MEEAISIKTDRGLPRGQDVATIVQTTALAAKQLMAMAGAYKNTGDPALIHLSNILLKGAYEISHGTMRMSDGINNLKIDEERKERLQKS